MGHVNINKPSLSVLGTVVVLLTTTIIFVTTSDNAYARYDKYASDTSQAAALSNDCLNPIFDSNNIDNVVGIGNCGGTVSQQDESGSASAPITHQTANPSIELQRATTTTTQPPLTGTPPSVGGCVECFDSLSNIQQEMLLLNIEQETGEMIQLDSIEALCELLVNPVNIDFNDLLDDVRGALDDLNLSEEDFDNIIICLNNVFML